MNEIAFRNSCRNKHIEVAKWLYSLGEIDIHVMDDFAFKWSCKNNDIEMVKWLYSLGEIDIQKNDDFIFIYCCKNMKIIIAKWMSGIHSNYKLKIKKGWITKWSIGGSFDELLEKENYEKIKVKLDIKNKAIEHDKCPICITDYSNLVIETECGHALCFSCIYEWRKNKNTCPVCRKKLEYSYCSVIK